MRLTADGRSIELPPGLIWRGATIHIDTCVGGRRISRSCRTANPMEARRILDAVRGQAVVAQVTGVIPIGLRPRVGLARFLGELKLELQVEAAAPRTITAYSAAVGRLMRFKRGRFRREPAFCGGLRVGRRDFGR